VRESKGFTLLELLVVVAVIGLLASISIPVIGGATKRARSATCINNLKQLHVAVMTYCQEGRRIPNSSSSISQSQIPDPDGGEPIIGESGTAKGWVDWHDDGSGGGTPDYRTYWWGTNGLQSIRNGSLWDYVGDKGVYCCAEFRKLARSKGKRKGGALNYQGNSFSTSPTTIENANRRISTMAVRSYGLNASVAGRDYNSLEAPHRQVLFADMGYENCGKNYRALRFVSVEGDARDEWHDPGIEEQNVPNDEAGSIRVRYYRSWDGALDWWRGGGVDEPYELIGDYHGKDKRGNVVFADGHTESVLSEDTEAVCTGEWGL
jgi:prepilin-type N-terminal cleavage/methylation domain-containing protein/prepilin-type processing-associated H-X9-DG protein